MGLFDLGASESSSSSQSTSNRDTFIAPSQLPFLQELWSQTGSLAGQMTSPAAAMANQLGQSLLPQGQQFSNALSGISQGRFGQGLQQSIQGLQSLGGASVPGALQGTAALQGIGQGAQGLVDSLSQPNPGLQGSLDYLSANIQENLQSTLGNLSGQAALQGASSGSRQALGIGQAASSAGRDFAGQAAGLIGQDMSNRQAMAPAIMGQALQAQLGAASQLQQGDLAQRGQMLQADQQRLQGLLGASQAQLGAAGLQSDAAQAGMSGLSNLFNLGMAPFTAAFGPLAQAASIFGGPAILEQMRSQSTSESTSESASFGFGLPQNGFNLFGNSGGSGSGTSWGGVF